MTVASALLEGAAALGIDVDAKAQTTLADYLTLLEKWNRTHNLTAIRDPSQMVTHHLLDSLATLGLPGFGYGIDYEYGLFKQEIRNGQELEKPDNWRVYGTTWEIDRPQDAIGGDL